VVPNSDTPANKALADARSGLQDALEIDPNNSMIQGSPDLFWQGKADDAEGLAAERCWQSIRRIRKRITHRCDRLEQARKNSLDFLAPRSAKSKRPMGNPKKEARTAAIKMAAGPTRRMDSLHKRSTYGLLRRCDGVPESFVIAAGRDESATMMHASRHTQAQDWDSEGLGAQGKPEKQQATKPGSPPTNS